MKIRIEFSFLVLNALIFLLCTPNTVLCFYTVCVAHELGHIMALVLTGGRLRSVTFSAFGIVMDAEKQPTAPATVSLSVLLAGPLVNLTVFFILTLLDADRSAALMNLAAAIYNLLPYRSLDGGAVLDLLLTGIAAEYCVNRLLFWLKFGISAVLFAAVLTGKRGLLSVTAVSVMLLLCDVRGTRQASRP